MGFWKAFKQGIEQAQPDKGVGKALTPQPDAGPVETPDQLAEYLDAARTFFGAPSDKVGRTAIRLKPGEALYLELEGAQLVEPKKAPTRISGRSGGVSYNIGNGTRLRSGGTRARIVEGEEQPTVVDVGVLSVTDRRAVFVGARATREWEWDKLVGVTHTALWSGLHVTGRGKASGVGYDAQNATLVQQRLELAITAAEGSRADLVAELEAEVSGSTGAGASGG